MLPEMQGWDPGQHPKLFIGYSDNTSLLSWLTCHCHVPVVHGPMLEGRLAKGSEGYDDRSFLSLITGDAEGLELSPDGVTTVVEGEVTGPLYGGTLTQLCASLGTPFAFDPPEGCVLFLEDVNERPYKIDRMLMQLRLSGILRRAQALVFGEMRGCDEPEGRLKTLELLPELLEDFDGPVVAGFPSGHTTGPMWSLPFGVQVTLKAFNRPALVVEESPVE
jgi:muramoyltetrapeptide carboxypeptidase